MSQRESGYEHKERDLYETPEWVTEALLPHLPASCQIVWEPAAGSGRMSRSLALSSPPTSPMGRTSWPLRGFTETPS